MAAPRNNIQKVGENIEVEVTPDEIVIRIKKDHRGEVSASGKTIRVASTLGNKQVTQEGIIVGINAYVYNDR